MRAGTPSDPWWLAVAACAAALGGCSGDDGDAADSVVLADSDATTTETTTTETTTTTPDSTLDVNLLPDLRPIEVVKQFECNPGAIPADTEVADVAGEPGAAIVLRPAGAAPCSYDLVYKGAGGDTAVLSTTPGGFLLTIAGKAPSGRVVLCASEVEHQADPATDASSPDRMPRVIDAVRIVCAAREPGATAWSPLSPVIVPDGAWAAWVLGLEEGANDYRLVWGRDFSYQFLNSGARERPADDGLYVTNWSFGASGIIVAESQRLGPMPDPETDEFGGWAPTSAELEELEAWIPDSGDGDCPPPGGCPLPPEELGPDATP